MAGAGAGAGNKISIPAPGSQSSRDYLPHFGCPGAGAGAGNGKISISIPAPGPEMGKISIPAPGSRPSRDPGRTLSVFCRATFTFSSGHFHRLFSPFLPSILLPFSPLCLKWQTCFCHFCHQFSCHFAVFAIYGSHWVNMGHIGLHTSPVSCS